MGKGGKPEAPKVAPLAAPVATAQNDQVSDAKVKEKKRLLTQKGRNSTIYTGTGVNNQQKASITGVS